MELLISAEAAVWAGRQQAFAMIAPKCSAAQAQCLREIRETRAHDALGLTWDEYCPRHAGISRSHADSLIRRLEEFGEAYFHLSELTRVSPETFRQIAARVSAADILAEDELIGLHDLARYSLELWTPLFQKLDAARRRRFTRASENQSPDAY